MARTVTDFGSNFSDSLLSCNLADMGFGTTVLGASKVLTLSTFGAVSVSPNSRLARHVSQLQLNLGWLIRIDVRDFQPQLSIFGFCRDRVHARQADVFMGVVARIEGDGQERRILERHVHLVDVVGWRQDHFFMIGHDHGLQHIYHLGNIGAADAIRVPGKDIQVQGGENGVAKAVLLD